MKFLLTRKENFVVQNILLKYVVINNEKSLFQGKYSLYFILNSLQNQLKVIN
jgi:hypothetical protein